MAQIRKRGTNKWQIVIYLGKDEKPYFETIEGTKTKAKERANELEPVLKKKISNKNGKITTVGHILDKWLQETKVYDRTYEKYAYHCRRLKPVVGDLELDNLNPLMIIERLKVFQEEGLAERTIKDFYTSLKTAFNFASTMNIYREDIMRGIKHPQVVYKDRNILKENQLNIFIETAKEYKHYLVLRILALTGMRIGEALGLMWKDINWETGEISILRAVNTKKRTLKNTKTKTSPRIILLDLETLSLLKEHRRSLPKSNNTERDLIFQNDEGGRPLRYNAVRMSKERVLKKAGLHHIRIHDLRHGTGSIMLNNGFSITDVAETLGQKPATTAGVYAHALRKGKSIANILEKV